MLKHLYAWIVYTNIWVSLSASVLTFFTLYLYKNNNVWVIALVFFSTLFAYNFQRITRLGKYDVRQLSAMHQWMVAHKTLIHVLMAIAAIGVIVSLLFLHFRVWFLLLPAGILSINYTVSFFKARKSPGLREIPGLKIFLISFVWVVATVWLPILDANDYEVMLWPRFWWASAERFVFVLAITIPFDIRDLKFDEASKNTLPQLLGITNAKLLAIFLVLLAMCSYEYLRFYGYYHGFIDLYYQLTTWPLGYLSFIAPYLIIIALIAFSSPNRKEWYFTFLVEAAPFLLLVEGLYGAGMGKPI